MLFNTDSETAYDLRFTCLGVPVRVNPTFWLSTLLSGGQLLQGGGGYDYFAIWVAVVFISILWHEMGHALAGIRHGAQANVILYGFGGLASIKPPSRDWAVRVWISFAGPFAGFILAWLLSVVLMGLRMPVSFSFGWPHLVDWELSSDLPPRMSFFVSQMLHVNIFWGLLNLLPVEPLDGGRIATELLMKQRPWDGRKLALQLGMVAAIGGALYLYRYTGTSFFCFFLIVLAYNNYLQLNNRVY